MLQFQYPVNVSSVPQLSVFRYPGGKTWFVPYLRLWLKSKHPRPQLLCEPFGGGGIIGLTCAAEKLSSSVHINELDPIVAAVWHTILSDDYEWLCNRITTFDLTYDNVVEVLSMDTEDTRSRAFKTILRNRCGHGGILAEGGGLLKHGENGRGIASRWYPSTLDRRIRTINAMKDRILFTQEDALEVIQKYSGDKSVSYFVDPPYTAGKNGKRAGKRLYRYSEIDHENLFQLMSEVKGDYLITYDNDPEVLELALINGMNTALIPMKNTHNTTMNELIISNSMQWMEEKESNQSELFPFPSSTNVEMKVTA
jgi:DNA adenine methylase